MHIIPRDDWGFTGWTSRPGIVATATRSKIVLHYTGGSHYGRTGGAFPREIDSWHKSRGWFGVGYNYLIDQRGAVFEGRGLQYIGSHAEGHNVESWGILIGVGGDQEPSDAAKRSALELIAWLREKRGRAIPVVGHRDVGSTDCPGEPIYDWIREGLPSPEEDDMRLDEVIDYAGFAEESWEQYQGSKIDSGTVDQTMQWSLGAALRALAELRELRAEVRTLASAPPEIDVEALAARLAEETDVEMIKTALREVLPEVRLDVPPPAEG
jgi:hypothetical protein